MILKAIKRLKERGDEFSFTNYTDRKDSKEYGGDPNGNWKSWTSRIKELLQNTVTSASEPFIYFYSAEKIPLRGFRVTNFEEAKSNYFKALESLEVILEEGDVYNELLDKKNLTHEVKIKSTALPQIENSNKNKVFIVHGHDHSLKTDLEIFLSRLQLEPIVLHRESDGGQTLIEKFEANSDVAFVFVLLTPDEVAYTANQLEKEDEKRKKEYRARPNVIFEFGYFVGKLGRKKVCALHKGDVTLPSDLNGVIYKKVDASIEDIGYALIKELKTAGLSIVI